MALSCDCDCDYDYTYDFYRETVQTCRKPRKCSECSREIGKGERYTYVVGKGDGHIDTFSVCPHCQAATDYIRKIVACWCYTLGDRWQNNDDFEGEPFAVRRFAVAARRKWARKRGPRKGELYPVPWVPKLETA